MATRKVVAWPLVDASMTGLAKEIEDIADKANSLRTRELLVRLAVYVTQIKVALDASTTDVENFPESR